MSSSRLSRRTWIGAGIPLLAVVLTGALLFAVRSGDSAQGAPSPQPAIAAAPSATVQKTVTLAPTSAATDADAEPHDLLPSDGLPDEIVARVADAIITQQDLNEAIVIDAIMAGLAGQAPTLPTRLVEQLINTEVVLQQAGESAIPDATGALETFLQRHNRDYGDLAAALATNAIAQDRFDRYFARFVAADASLRRQQAITGAEAAQLMGRWQRTARISFGPVAATLQQAAAESMPSAPLAVQVGSELLPEEVAPATTKVVDEPVAESTEPRGFEVGQLAPEFTLPSLSSDLRSFSLRDLNRSPGVLIFWTTWCPYCLRQTPALVDAYDRWQEQGIEFVGINVQEERSVVESYVAQHNIEYPVLLDERASAATDYAIQGYPTTYFIDSDHRIIARHVGALTEEQLNHYLLMLRPPE